MFCLPRIYQGLPIFLKRTLKFGFLFHFSEYISRGRNSQMCYSFNLFIIKLECLLRVRQTTVLGARSTKINETQF